MVEILESYTVSDPDAQKAIKGALWILKRNEEKAKCVMEDTSKIEGHVMISYSWSEKERMRELAYYLKNLGFSIWIDVEQMEGSVLEKMAEAVESASIILIGVSSHYKESQACRTEASYAYRLKKKALFVFAEDGYIPTGWLGAMVGNDLYYKPWEEEGEEYFEQEAQKIADQIKRFGVKEESFSSARSTLPLSSSPSAAALKTPTKRLLTYDEVSLPTMMDPLPIEKLHLEEISTWSPEDVCRWLIMTGMEALTKPFFWHGITGPSLLEWGSRGFPDPDRFKEKFQIEKESLFLDLQRAVRHLSRGLGPLPQVQQLKQASCWKEEEVKSWLIVRNLEPIAAKVQGWNGEVLLGLFKLASSASFFPTLQGFGIDNVALQLRLLAQLSLLFE